MGTRAQKRNVRREQYLQKLDDPYEYEPRFTRLDRLLAIFTTGIMIYLFLAHFTSDQAWAKYAGYMASLTILGFGGTQLLTKQKIGAVRKYKYDTLVMAGILLALSMVTQIVVKTALTFSTVEQALYFVFAAVAEELFFRVFFITLILRWNPPLTTKLLGVLVQAIMFAAYHKNYYDNFPMLLSVFLGGLIYGLFYLWRENPTANILAHFLLNLYAVRSLVFVL